MRINSSLWNFYDLVKVILIISGLTLLYFIPVTFFVINENNRDLIILLGEYIVLILLIFVPIFWVTRKYNVTKDSLGIVVQRKSVLKYSIIGILFAIIYFIILQFLPFQFNLPTIPTEQKASASILTLILFPLTLVGFRISILSPIAEEVFFRGFIYGYFRKRFGIKFGLIIQTIIFTSLHTFYITRYFDYYALINVAVIGLILGSLYEITGSIYPSIIFHCTFNYIISVQYLFKF